MIEQPTVLQSVMIALALAVVVIVFAISLRFVNQIWRGNRRFRLVSLFRRTRRDPSSTQPASMKPKPDRKSGEHEEKKRHET